ncbi:helix-turn-helix transcriptional regulator [bacterium]|nr:helix-turn-helix transcriptional regulator [bacterium]
MISNKLSEILGRKRINKAELSRLSGISYSSIKNIYYNKTKGIEFETLNKLCNFLECTPNDLFEFTPD